MKSNRILTVICLWILNSVAIASAQQNPDSIFEHYFRNAQAFADTYPQEKAYLHFDNTSYYIGDTIWFKAYVTLAEGNLPSIISKPLYVELLDQLGNITDRQIIKLDEGEGHGQIILKTSSLPGYYEVRAYTRWMQAFDEKQCFSRTFPIYRSTLKNGEIDRSIGTYRLDESMKQRPHPKEKKLNLRFFPERGNMVQGVASLVAFEAESTEDGPIPIEGIVKDKEGTILTRFRALHEGMGYFAYRPEEKPATVEVEYKEKTYRFPLPEALPQGYVLHTAIQKNKLDIQVTRSSDTLDDTLALFISQQGRPIIYKRTKFDKAQMMRFTIPKNKLSDGVTQISLINAKGETLCERLCYVISDNKDNHLRIQANISPTTLYKPCAPIFCQLSVKDKDKKPVSTHLSVAIRDALSSDYMEYDHNIYTDQLLTSDLKGYIHQPGYYFASKSPQRQRELDALMLVKGWKKYDMSQIIGAKTFTPACMPERALIVHGQVCSYVRQKAKSEMGITVMVSNGLFPMTGATTTDSLGYFDIPTDDIEGTVDALIQTRKKDKKHNKQTTIRLLRNYSPSPRKYGYQELHPTYADMDNLRILSTLADSLYEDSIMKLDGSHTLKEVVIKAKRRKSSHVDKFEQNMNAYYDVPFLLDKLRDEGENVEDLLSFLALVNPNIALSRTRISLASKDDKANLLLPIEYDRRGAEQEEENRPEKSIDRQMVTIATYNSKPMLYLVNGELFTPEERRIYIENDIDAIKYITLGQGKDALERIDTEKSKVSIHDYKTINEKYFDKAGTIQDNKTNRQKDREDEEGGDWSDQVSSAGICSISTVDNWEKGKQYGGSWGVRRTQLQGYSKPLDFYSPTYNSKKNLPKNDHRRTLYWNPNVETDENGEAVINCYNTNVSSFLTISAETLWKGKPAALIK